MFRLKQLPVTCALFISQIITRFLSDSFGSDASANIRPQFWLPLRPRNGPPLAARGPQAEMDAVPSVPRPAAQPRISLLSRQRLHQNLINVQAENPDLFELQLAHLVKDQIRGGLATGVSGSTRAARCCRIRRTFSPGCATGRSVRRVAKGIDLTCEPKLALVR